MPIKRKQGRIPVFFIPIACSLLPVPFCLLPIAFCLMIYQDFIDYLKYEKRVSPHTVTAYESDLSQFFRFLEEKLEIHQLPDVHSGDVRAWVISLLEDESLDPRSVGGLRKRRPRGAGIPAPPVRQTRITNQTTKERTD